MKISATAIFVGPSVHAQQPVVHFTLDGSGQRPLRSADRGLLDDWFSRVPGLRTHAGLCGAENCFRNVGDGDLIPSGHLFEHVCIVLQNLAGADLSCVREAGDSSIAANCAVIPYEEPDVCIEAARLACDLIAGLPPGDPLSTAAEPAAFDFASRLDEFVRFAAAIMLPVQDRALIRTARALDIPARRLVGRTITLGDGRFQRRLSATKTSLTDVVSNDLAANKDYSRRVFEDLGLPVPRYKRVHTSRDAAAAARRIGFPVVVKPNNGSMGSGVSVGMKNRAEVLAAYKRARKESRSVLVEEVVEGADYRMLVVNGRLCAASRREPGHVVGDGVHTVEQLVNEVNSDPRRGSGPTSSWTRIELDEQADRLITERGYTRTSIPPDGEILYLRRNANTSDGGTAVDVTDEVHPDNRDIAVRAARAIGLDIAGVDFLTTDISSSMWKNGGRICEINSRPGLRKHLWPAKGRPRDVITPIIDMLIPAGQPSRIPVVAVTGSGSTGVVARMLAHILTAAGHHVGLAADRRVYSGGRRIGRGRLSPPKAARAIFLDPDVDAAVLEMAPDDVVQHGLGCDTFNVVVVINAHEASATDDQRAALRVVARAARDVVYVGHSDDGAAAIESACGSAALCRVLADPARGPAPAGGRRAVIEGGSIAIYDGLRSLVQIPRADLLKGQAGAGGAGNAEAALYASVAAFSLGQDPKDIFRSLGTFDPTPPSRKGAGRRQRARTRKKPDDELQASGLSTKTVQSSAVPVADASGTAAAGAGKRAANGRFTTRPVAKS